MTSARAVGQLPLTGLAVPCHCARVQNRSADGSIRSRPVAVFASTVVCLYLFEPCACWQPWIFCAYLAMSLLRSSFVVWNPKLATPSFAPSSDFGEPGSVPFCSCGPRPLWIHGCDWACRPEILAAAQSRGEAGPSIFEATPFGFAWL